jgi:uncharacterized repeat protein (TIGR01451 family)
MPSTRISLYGTLLCLLWFCAPSAFAQSSDLGVIKNGPSTAASGSNVPITYTLSVNNAGPDDATNPSLIDALPAGMTFASITQNTGPTFTCVDPGVGNNGTINCTIGTFANGATATFTLVAKITTANPGDFYQNTATVQAVGDPNPENDSSPAGTQIPGPSADVYVTKTGPSAAPPNTDVTYTITVGNTGPDDAANVQLNDTLPNSVPAGSPLTFVAFNQISGPTFNCPSPGATITCTINPLPSGTVAQFQLVAHVPPVGSGTSYTNTATIEASTSDPVPDNNSSSSTFTVSSVDLSVLKSASATVTAGQNVTYSITLSNGGPDAAANASVVDTLPPNTSFVSAVQNTGPAGSCVESVSGQVTCSIANAFANGATASFTIVAHVATNTANGTILTNTATTSTSSFDTNPNNNTATASTTVQNTADLSVVKSGPATVTTGTTVSYTVTLSNAGPDVAGTPSFSDTLQAGLSFVSITQNSGPAFNCTGGATVTCNRPAGLAAGASASFTLVAAVSSTLTGGSTVSNTATAASTGAPDPTPGNNSSTTNATVIFVAPPTVTAPALTWLGLLLLSVLIGTAAVRRHKGFRR